MLVIFNTRVLIQLCDLKKITKLLGFGSHYAGVMVYKPQRGCKGLIYITVGKRQPLSGSHF